MFSLLINFFHLLVRKPNLEKKIYLLIQFYLSQASGNWVSTMTGSCFAVSWFPYQFFDLRLMMKTSLLADVPFQFIWDDKFPLFKQNIWKWKGSNLFQVARKCRYFDTVLLVYKEFPSFFFSSSRHFHFRYIHVAEILLLNSNLIYVLAG